MKAFKRVTALLVAVMMVMSLCTVSVFAAEQRTLRVDVSSVAGGIAAGDSFEISYYAAVLDTDTKVTTVTFEVPYDDAKFAVEGLADGIATPSNGTTTGGDPCFKVFAFNGSGYGDFEGGAEVLVAKVKVTALTGVVAGEEISFMPSAPVVKCNNEAGNKDFDNKVGGTVTIADKTKTLTSSTSATAGVKTDDEFTVSYAFDTKGQNVTGVSFVVDYDETAVALESTNPDAVVADGKLTVNTASTTIDGITATVLAGAVPGTTIALNPASVTYTLDGIDGNLTNVNVVDGIGAATKVLDAFDVATVEEIVIDTYPVGTAKDTILADLAANYTEVDVTTTGGADKTVPVKNWTIATYNAKSLNEQVFTATLDVDGVVVTNSGNAKAEAKVTLQPLDAVDAAPVLADVTITQKISGDAYTSEEAIAAVKTQVGAIAVTKGDITDTYSSYDVALGSENLQNEGDTTTATITLSGASDNGLFNLAAPVNATANVVVGGAALDTADVSFVVNSATGDVVNNMGADVAINITFADGSHGGERIKITAKAETGETAEFTDFWAPYVGSTVVAGLGKLNEIFTQEIAAGQKITFGVELCDAAGNPINTVLTYTYDENGVENGTQQFATVTIASAATTKLLTITTERTDDNSLNAGVAEIRDNDEFDITYTLTDEDGNEFLADSLNMEIDYDDSLFEITAIEAIGENTIYNDANYISINVVDGKIKFVVAEKKNVALTCNADTPILKLHVKALDIDNTETISYEFAPELIKYTLYTAADTKPDLTIYDDVEINDTTGIVGHDKYPVVEVEGMDDAAPLTIQEELGNNLVYGKTLAEVQDYLNANYTEVTVIDPIYRGTGYDIPDKIAVTNWTPVNDYDYAFQGEQLFVAELVEDEYAYNPNGIKVYANLILSPIMPPDIYMTNLPADFEIEEDPYGDIADDIEYEVKRRIGDPAIEDDVIEVANGVGNIEDTYDYSNVEITVGTYTGALNETIDVTVTIKDMSEGDYFNAVPPVSEVVRVKVVPYVLTTEITWEANPNPEVGANDTITVDVDYNENIADWAGEPVTFIVTDTATGKAASVQQGWTVPSGDGAEETYTLGNLERILGYTPDDSAVITVEMMVGDNPVAYSYNETYNVLENKVLAQELTVSTPLLYGDGNDDGIIDTYEDIDAIVNHYLNHITLRGRVAMQLDVAADYNAMKADPNGGMEDVYDLDYEDIATIIDHYLGYLTGEFEADTLNADNTVAGHLGL